MAFRLARPDALAVIAVSLALPASASAADSSGGSAAPVETGPGYDLNAPSGGAAAGAVKPAARPKKKNGGSKSSHKRKKKSSSSRPRFPVAGPHHYRGPPRGVGPPPPSPHQPGPDAPAGA